MKCRDCMYSVAVKLAAIPEINVDAEVLLYCRRYPKELPVKDLHWCGEFKERN
jgi:hypothetical protein